MSDLFDWADSVEDKTVCEDAVEPPSDRLTVDSSAAQEVSAVDGADFRLVPHEVFLSWSHEQQLRYCALRDRASAFETEEDDDAMWLLERAASYEAML